MTLKPCPFCGGDPEYDGNDEVHYLRCLNCGAETAGYNSEEDAVQAWQARAVEEQAQ